MEIIGYIYLDEEDILEIHSDQIQQFGGSEGIRNRDGLLGAIGQPQQTWDGEDLYPDPFQKAAVLAYGISEGQVFVDGNKRTALVAALTFLSVNGYEVPTEAPGLYEAMMKVSRREMTKEELAEFFRSLSM